MLLGHHHPRATLTWDLGRHLQHCPICGPGSTVACVSEAYAVYRCVGPDGHLFLRCPIHRSYVLLDSVSRVATCYVPHCLCFADDVESSSTFARLDQWTHEDGKLVRTASLLLHRAAVDLILRGGLKRRDGDKRVFMYKSRPAVADARSMLEAQRLVREWFGLKPEALSVWTNHWTWDMTSHEVLNLITELGLVVNRKQKRDPGTENDELALVQAFKRVRLVAEPARHENAIVDERNPKRAKHKHVFVARHARPTCDIENERPLKRTRLEGLIVV
jgi:hypothetical protein